MCKNSEVFSTVLLVRTNFYFMNQTYFIIASSIQKFGSVSDHENCYFYCQTPYDFTYKSSQSELWAFAPPLHHDSRMRSSR